LSKTDEGLGFTGHQIGEALCFSSVHSRPNTFSFVSCVPASAPEAIHMTIFVWQLSPTVKHSRMKMAQPHVSLQRLEHRADDPIHVHVRHPCHDKRVPLPGLPVDEKGGP
jgi:hypothetical protein